MKANQVTSADRDKLSDPILASPLDHLQTECGSLRSFCCSLEAYADDALQPAYRTLAQYLLKFIATDLPCYIEDGTRLIALLQKDQWFRAYFPKIKIATYQKERIALERASRILVQDLCLLASGSVPEKPLEFINRAATAVAILRLRLDWEEHYLLPLARHRLSAEDQEALNRPRRPRRSLLS